MQTLFTVGLSKRYVLSAILSTLRTSVNILGNQDVRSATEISTAKQKCFCSAVNYFCSSKT